MYDHVGKKIQVFAKFAFFVEAFCAALAGLVAIGEEELLMGILLLVCVPGAAWIGSWGLYAFGQLVEDVHDLSNKSFSIIVENPKHQTKEEIWNKPPQVTKSSPVIAKPEIETHPIAATKNKGEVAAQLLCPVCGEDLSFMGWGENELKETQTCPLCGKKILFKQ